MQDRTKHDMSTIVHPVNLLVDTEYEWAAQLHGAVFASPHEGYGVIAEELLEVQNENVKIVGGFQSLLQYIQQEDPRKMMDMADAIRDAAVNAAAECIQVAAMCQKMGRTICNDAAL